jgi:hypothetical protein
VKECAEVELEEATSLLGRVAAEILAARCQCTTWITKLEA